MATAFQQAQTTSISDNGFTFDLYAWSTAANWSNGVPGNGAAATVNIIGGGNPSGYDDIANLFLDSLYQTSGFTAVAGSLTVGTVYFGSSTASIYSDTVLGSPAASLTINGMSGTLGRIGAFGANALTTVASATDPGEIYQVDLGGELVLNATPLANPGNTQSGFYYQNDGTPAGTFAFMSPGSTIADPLAGVAIGDSIALPGSHVTSVTYGANSLSVTTDLGITTFSNVSYSGTMPGGFMVSSDPSGLERITFIACYRRGTLIETNRGDKRVEKLKVGDEVITRSGVARPIKWIGRRSYGGRFIMGCKDILPICIKAGALDHSVPRRDLWISPHHAMYVDDVLIEAKDLINGTSVVQADQVDAVEYFHIELDTHDVIIAEGALSESYVDDDNRGMFHNAHEYYALYPDAEAAPALYCAPRVEEGYEIEAVRRRIARRAGTSSTANGPHIGGLHGFVDEMSESLIEGWAQNLESPEALDIYADGRLIGQTLANLYRDDLARAGVGSGRHSFAFAVPEGLAFAADAIDVRRALDGTSLKFSAGAIRTPGLRSAPSAQAAGK